MKNLILMSRFLLVLSGVAFFNQNDLTRDEKTMLLDYLQFIRKKKA